MSVNILKANIRKILGGAETLFENTLPDCFFCSMIVLEQNPASPMYRIIVQYGTLKSQSIGGDLHQRPKKDKKYKSFLYVLTVSDFEFLSTVKK